MTRTVYILLRQSAFETYRKFFVIYSSFKTVTSVNKKKMFTLTTLAWFGSHLQTALYSGTDSGSSEQSQILNT